MTLKLVYSAILPRTLSELFLIHGQKREKPNNHKIFEPPLYRKRKKDTAEVSFFMVGGGEGSRTPVRK